MPPPLRPTPVPTEPNAQRGARRTASTTPEPSAQRGARRTAPTALGRGPQLAARITAPTATEPSAQRGARRTAPTALGRGPQLAARITALGWALGLALPAHAGWIARESHQDAHGNRRSAAIYYQAGKLRIESPGDVVVVDLRRGELLLIRPGLRAYAQTDLGGLAKVERAAKARMMTQLKQAPPEVQARVKARVAQMEADQQRPSPLIPVKGPGRALGQACQRYRWTAGDGDGQVCVAQSVSGVSMEPFLRDARAFLKLAKAAQASAQTIPLLRSAAQGFPLTTTRTLTVAAGRRLETHSHLTSVKTAQLPAATFAPPPGYARRDLIQLVAPSEPSGAGRRRAPPEATPTGSGSQRSTTTGG